jgi:hypothetical protein
MRVDVMVVAASVAVIPGRSAAFSALSAFAQSLVVFAYHRPGRYAGG